MRDDENAISASVRQRLREVQRVVEQIDEGPTENLLTAIEHAPAVFVTGKGRSGYIARCFAMRLMQMGLETHVPGEATCPRLVKEDLLIAVSCSGTTKTTVEISRLARDAGARVVVLTATAESELSSLAHELITVPITEQTVTEGRGRPFGPHNNTLFEETLLLYFDALIPGLMRRLDIPPSTLDRRHANLE
ncbi:MAG: 6-phospho-3-hexuloisomerase [Candidatus Brocadiia bacterium]